MMKVVRVLIYEGPEEWIKETAARSGVPWVGMGPWCGPERTIRSNVDGEGKKILTQLAAEDPETYRDLFKESP